MKSYDNSKNTFTVNFSRGDQQCDPAGKFQTLDEAILFAQKEAASWAGHPDFKGGLFEVWEHGTPESQYGNDHFRDSVYPVLR